jgi:hypothetical protein
MREAEQQEERRRNLGQEQAAVERQRHAGRHHQAGQQRDRAPDPGCARKVGSPDRQPGAHQRLQHAHEGAAQIRERIDDGEQQRVADRAERMPDVGLAGERLERDLVVAQHVREHEVARRVQEQHEHEP